MLTHTVPKASEGWQAWLHLQLARQGEATRLAAVSHQGPLRVQRPFHPEGTSLPHLYLLHPPGGMVTGDQLQLDVSLLADACALLTTPSAGKVYRADHSSRRQQQRCRFQVADGAMLEWLPQETIVFNGARGELITEVELADSARCLLWDIVCLGRPASQEVFAAGYMKQTIHIRRNGRVCYHERNRFEGGSELLQQWAGLQGEPVSGTLLATVLMPADDLDTLRTGLQQLALPGRMAVSQRDDLLLARYIGPSAAACRHGFEWLWAQLRPGMNDRPAIPPRVWQT